MIVNVKLCRNTKTEVFDETIHTIGNKEKIVHGRGPSNQILISFFHLLMFAGLHNHFPV